MRSPAIVIGAVLALIIVVTTLATFGMGLLLDDSGPVSFDVEGTRDGSPVTGTVVIEDSGESGRERIMRVTAELVCGGSTERLETYLFLNGDGSPNTGFCEHIGQREVGGVTTEVWRMAATPGYSYCFDGTSVVAVIIQVEGYDCLAS